MISNPSLLSDRPSALVLDASVVINILACGDTQSLLRAMGCDMVIPQQVVEEILHNPSSSESGANALSSLIDLGLMRRHGLSENYYAVFVDLVGAEPPDGLGDGEAATIATAEELGCACVIDERKATRIALGRRPDLHVLCTVDLFCAPFVRTRFAREELASLVHQALFNARMRVPHRYRTWVVDLIGRDAAESCVSLRRATLPGI